MTCLCSRHFRLGQLAPVTGGGGQLSQRCAGKGIAVPTGHIRDGVVGPVVAADHITHLGNIPGTVCGGCGSLLGCGFGVGLAAFHLHTTVGTVPIDIEANFLANVPQLHIVVAVDDIGFHLRFFSIYDNAMVTALCHDPGSIGRGSDASQQQAGEKTGCKTSSLHGVYLQIL